MFCGDPERILVDQLRKIPTEGGFQCGQIFGIPAGIVPIVILIIVQIVFRRLLQDLIVKMLGCTIVPRRESVTAGPLPVPAPL